MIVVLGGCQGRRAQDDTVENDDTDSTDTSDETWWEGLPVGFALHLSGHGYDRDFKFESDTTCSHLADGRYEAVAENQQRQSYSTYLCALAPGETTTRLPSTYLSDLNNAECASYPSWWSGFQDNADAGYLWLVNDPSNADEQLACWLDVHLDGTALAERFECPYLRDGSGTDDPATVTGTMSCTIHGDSP